ncbi:Anthocyanidin reductase [Triticum urartu]|uniref:Anthocyanidin reductase n=1 Tax=Triticum urartu TaxID=4572 RepID=M7YTJ6_TRIUA|nr:Anthocyanidin reductase [Triticum urartu]
MAAAGDGTTRKTACVTGGSGYIASALVKMLLEKGYAVKTTVRNPDDAEKNAHLKTLAALGPLEVFRADLNEEGSFDDAVAGCDYAFLVAAPVALMPENAEEEVIQPAIQGTLNVMRSCVKAGTVKRVVLTSSTAAISSRPLEGDGHVLDEDSWSDVDYLRATKSGTWAYPASKVLAEKAAMAFAEEKGLSLVTVCPVVVVGGAPATNVKTSVPEVLSLLSGDDDMVDNLELIEKASGSIPLVHIDDYMKGIITNKRKIPEADLSTMAAEEATSGRYIVCTLNTTAVALAHFLAAKYPQYEINDDRIGHLPEKPRVSIWSDKLIKEGFEYKYKNLEEIYDDLVVYGRTLGLLKY